MQLDYLMLADAFAVDSQGGVSLIRIGGDVIHRAALPSNVRRTVVCSVMDDRGEESRGKLFTTHIAIVSPSGVEVLSYTNKAPITVKQYPDYPAHVVTLAELVIPLNEFGEYRILSITTDNHGEEVSGEIPLHVLEGFPAQPIAPVGPAASDA